MRLDDLRTLAYQALEQLAAKCQVADLDYGLFEQAKNIGLCDFKVDDRTAKVTVFPLASKPATQVAGVIGIDSHGGMGER